MSDSFRVDLGYPVILEFRGPDAVRFLNGQVTQDVRKLDQEVSLSACVTDAKGKLQFRVYLLEVKPGVVWVTAPAGPAEELEARLSKYLIADDVEITDRTGEFQLFHVIGATMKCSEHGLSRRLSRFGEPGEDVWIPVDYPAEFPAGLRQASHDEVEAFRIGRGIPAWGSELSEGMLPPEAGLDSTDISYHKGCYIGQEVISRIKSAGKVNRYLVKVTLPDDVAAKVGDVLISADAEAGVLTSVSPAAEGPRKALGYLKRSADRSEVEVRTADGVHPVTIEG